MPKYNRIVYLRDYIREGLDSSTVQYIAGHLNFSTTESYIRDIGHKDKIEDVRRALS